MLSHEMWLQHDLAHPDSFTQYLIIFPNQSVLVLLLEIGDL